ncbi:MAG TPA: hypothetical protein VFI24_09775 [Pyrinomonadaceae bacterium]|nr:hypothetical protein [Pyrinomonadaceae bacterium]
MSRSFNVKAAERGTAFGPLRRKDLDLVFSLQHERVVGRDNTVSFANRSWQIEHIKLRGTLANCHVTVHEHLDGTLSITLGPHVVGCYQTGEAVEMTLPRKATFKVGSDRRACSPTFDLNTKGEHMDLNKPSFFDGPAIEDLLVEPVGTPTPAPTAPSFPSTVTMLDEFKLNYATGFMLPDGELWGFTGLMVVNQAVGLKDNQTNAQPGTIFLFPGTYSPTPTASVLAYPGQLTIFNRPVQPLFF